MTGLAVATDIEKAVERLKRYANRIAGSARYAMALQEIWAAFNEDGTIQKRVARSKADTAAAYIHDAVLHDLIMIIVRLMDKPGGHGRPIMQSDRISFPVVRELLNLPGVMEVFETRARGWPGGKGEEHVKRVRDEFQDMCGRIDRLQSGSDTPAELLRTYRHNNLAHELHIDTSDPKPKAKYGDVPDLLDEIVALTESVGLIVLGTAYAWERRDVAKSARALWAAVAEIGPPLDVEDLETR